jgi:hypothetical protein
MTADELKQICDLTLELTRLRQNEVKHLYIENYAPEVFGELLRELAENKRGECEGAESRKRLPRKENQSVFDTLRQQGYEWSEKSVTCFSSPPKPGDLRPDREILQCDIRGPSIEGGSLSVIVYQARLMRSNDKAEPRRNCGSPTERDL